jgi:hypothetical protein
MSKLSMLGLGTAMSLLVAALSPVLAQTSSSETPQAGQSGTTSGPASGSPATMGSGGTAPASPHQLEGTKDKEPSVKREMEQSGASGSSQEPRGPATGQPGSTGTQSGAAPKSGTGAKPQ